jgi:O-methyltransferase
LLIELVNARRVLEIGTFTGYSALAMALALPAGGQLVTCEQDAELIGLARGFWKDAGVADLIDARIGDAAATLEAMLEEEGPGLFDMVLIDADKPSYPRYLELAAELVRVGGLIVVDDTLIHGRVATGPLANDPDHVGAAVEAMRVVNDRLRHDERFTSVLLPLRDGLTLARRCS